MKRVVIFTEGPGELIFIRSILYQIIGYEHLSFDCVELNSGDQCYIPYPYNPPNAIIKFLLISVGTDERVLSEINDRHQWYVNRGYEIIGVRDMFSERYKEKSNHIINSNVNKYFIEIINNVIRQLSNPERIHFFFEIMELEAWLLGIYQIFQRIDPALTLEQIKNHLGFDLQTVDPETAFFHPAIQFEQVLRLVNITYSKHTSEMEKIVSHITIDDINGLVDTHRCNSFALFISEIRREYEEAEEIANLVNESGD